jgi:hypothetical protein
MNKKRNRMGLAIFLALIALPAAFGAQRPAPPRPLSLNDGACGTEATGGVSGANSTATSPDIHEYADRLAANRPSLHRTSNH